jgi:hypothetical protein
MSIRETFQTTIEEQLNAWGVQLAELRSNASAEVHAKYDAVLEEWKGAIAKLKELKAETGERWALVKVELEKAYHGIAAALEGAAATPPAAAAITPAPDPHVTTRITERNMTAVVPEGDAVEETR